MNSDEMRETTENYAQKLMWEVSLEKTGDALLLEAQTTYDAQIRRIRAMGAVVKYMECNDMQTSINTELLAKIKTAEQIVATEEAIMRLNKKVDAKRAAQAALSLAKRAKTPEDMLAKAETAIAMYMQYRKEHMTSRCADFTAQLDCAEKIAALAKLELAKHPVQRWIEQYWDLFI
jgi:hypothetical protein